jgi:hypothetical protein
MKAYAYCSATPGSLYDRMADVLVASGARNGVEVEIERVPRAVTRGDAFTDKAIAWSRAVHRATEPFALLDCDLVIARPLRDVWAHDFDVAVTTHAGALNSGVIFVRPSLHVRRFFGEWPQRTIEWCHKNPPGQKPRYSDQDALIAMLASAPRLVARELHMHEWNSTQLTWHMRSNETRVYHVKSGARAILEGANKRPSASETFVADLWRNEEQRCRRM